MLCLRSEDDNVGMICWTCSITMFFGFWVDRYGHSIALGVKRWTARIH